MGGGGGGGGVRLGRDCMLYVHAVAIFMYM